MCAPNSPMTVNTAVNRGMAMTPPRKRGTSTYCIGFTAIISIAESWSVAFIKPISDANDVQDFAILASDESDSVRESSRTQDAIGFGNFGVWVAEDRVVEFQRLGECCVLLDRITTGCEVGNVVFTQGLTARTERFTFSRSATSKGFREPGNDDSLFVFELRKFVGFEFVGD